ncbi:hypothetical protein EOW65_06710 [Sinirhodobacter ferrireducens]|uniref:Uncharacterized protein n=1 Tax=Paenirhodobacter ferrireducens TaxID=1215032 RepID=A0A443LNA2_9RHOB|nr:hypothetical protein [Sinirhodobacter ferrireducens]RWR50638.1 hypothetical protein EOW65_06710 [Sinirhodobacter ferrireducens]
MEFMMNFTFTIRSATIFSMIIVSSACFGADETTGPRTLTETETARMEDAIRSQLRDPDSAKFSDIVADGNSAMITVCGNVNSKNGYGGYTGKIPFSVFLMPNGDVPSIGEGDLMFETVMKICADVGVQKAPN